MHLYKPPQLIRLDRSGSDESKADPGCKAEKAIGHGNPTQRMILHEDRLWSQYTRTTVGPSLRHTGLLPIAAGNASGKALSRCAAASMATT